MATISFNNTVIARAAAAIYAQQLGKSTMDVALAQSATTGVDATINGVYNRDFGSLTHAQAASMVVANLGITGAGVAEATAYAKGKLDAGAAGTEGAVIARMAGDFANLTSNAVFGAAATAFNTKIDNALKYSLTGASDIVFGGTAVVTGGTFSLAVTQDNVTGTAFDDQFNARIIDTKNTLQSADVINGGAGTDRLDADIGSSQLFAITPETTGVEIIAIRAQTNATDSANNNPAGTPAVSSTSGNGGSVTSPVSNSAFAVQIDAQRMKDVIQWESNNSRSDVIIEDVRIRADQITSDITIAFVESDPGHVDFGVYFDQYSLKNQTSNTSSISLKIMDTVAAAAGKAPLLNSNYGAFTFTYTAGGVSTVVTLASQAIQDAQTYADMRAAFQNALDAQFGAGNAAATIGDNFTIIDPDSNKPVTGQTIVLTTKTAATFSTPAGSGWLADGTAPPASNFYTNFLTGSTISSSLVTSKVILDDVGRGSTGGDLVIGGLSVGQTSSSQGVQRFEIEVRDNSKLESITSTNNTLREVTIKNGVTSSDSHAYVPTVKDAGNLTVNGNSGTNGTNVTVAGNNAAGDSYTGTNTTLPGAGAQNTGGFGFADVRLIDATDFRGKLAFAAEVTAASIGKYMNLRDTQAQPPADNINFVYTGGVNDDALYVQIDGSVAASRSTIVSGREDFTFTLNGGSGKDSITLNVVNNNVVANTGLVNSVVNLTGGVQAWYTNQKLNANIFINAGDGDDTVRTPGAGDVIIDLGAGDDTAYVDNTGAQAISGSNGGYAGAAYASASAAELAQSLSVATLADATNAATTATRAANLNTLNLVTPVDFPVAVIAHTTMATATATAAANGSITLAQKIALDAAYNSEISGTVTTPVTLTAPTITGNTAVAGNLTAAEFAAGNALLETFIAAAKAAAATASAADANTIVESALLNATQLAVQNATLAQTNILTGTQTIVNNLAALNSVLAIGATDAQVVAALLAARTTAPGNTAISDAVATALFNAAVATAGTMDASELANAQLILNPLINTAANNNAAAATTLANAVTANNTAVNTASGIVGLEPVNAVTSAVANDAVGSVESATAATAASTASTTYISATLTPAITIATDLATLKAALAIGTTDLNFSILTANAVNKGTIAAGDKTALDNAATFGVTPVVTGTLDATEKTAVDLLMTALQLTAETDVANKTLISADKAAIAAATSLASSNATAAANSGGISTAATTSKGVYVVNTASQAADTTANGTYNRSINDERSLNDLKSGTNDSYNLYLAKLNVNFKGIEKQVTIPSNNFKTTDLHINQAIKDAINNDFVLNKLLVATDGPSSSLVITSLIDGRLSLVDLVISITTPASGVVSISDLAGAAAAYGVAADETSVLAVMTAAKVAFDAKADYIDQWAETGALAGNANIQGAASVTTSDNTITPGTGNDVVVLGTTVGVDALTSSNDTVVYPAGNFGNDTIVNFKAGALSAGGDILNFAGLGGSILGTAFNVNKSINVDTKVVTTNGTAALVAALYADSATAQTHVYAAVNTTTNIADIYSVVDAAGTGAGSVTATLVGTIDLADTIWATLTTVNFS